MSTSAVAQGDPESCLPSHWSSSFDSWCDTPYQPADDFCGDGPATSLLDAFSLTDLSAAPASFDSSLSLLGALSASGGQFELMLSYGTSALLSASHPLVAFPATPLNVEEVVQAALSGDITVTFALQVLAAWNAVEAFGGCPLTCGDFNAPTLECDASITIECGEPIPQPTITDDLDSNPTLSHADSVAYPSNCGLEATITRTWTATDSCGNSASIVQEIHVVDTTAPSLVIPPDQSLGCYMPGPAPFTGDATAMDNCDLSPIITYSDEITVGSCSQNLTLHRTWSASDMCGNSTSQIQTISYGDVTAPDLDLPSDITVSCDVDCYEDLSEVGEGSADDDCDPLPTITFTDQITSGSCDDSYTITRTWTAEDACGNAISGIQTITVIDDEAPELICPDDLTLSCEDPIELAGSPYVLDDCDPDPQIEFSETTTQVACDLERVVARTWTVTDRCGNSTSCTQIVTFVDNQPPVLYCPLTVTLECPNDASEVSIATAIDNCDESPTVTYNQVNYEYDPSSDHCPLNETIVRTYTAVDACGNMSQVEQVIHIVDTTPPVLLCPPTLFLNCEQELDDLPDAEVIDSCDEKTFLDCEDSEFPGNCANQTTILRTWVAIDACGNSSSCTQTIFLFDQQPPRLSVPPDLALPCDSEEETGMATATDNCDGEENGDGPVIESSEVTIAGSCPNEYTVEITWTATDACGNSTSQVQTITYYDDEAPDLDCPNDLVLDCTQDPGATDVSNTGVATASDNCDAEVIPTYEDQLIPSSCPQTYTVLRTWTATDSCDNTISCVQTIEVIDEDAPEIECPDDVTLDCTEDPDALPLPPAIDNCSSDVVVTRSDEFLGGNCPIGMELEVIVRTYTAVDDCGNTSFHTQTITIVDETPPTIECPPDTVVSCDQHPQMPVDPIVSDACDMDVTLTWSEEMIPGMCDDEMVVLRTWTATDDCGNEASCVQQITVIDQTAPVIECPDTVTISCHDDLNSVPLATAHDSCAGPVEVDHDQVQMDGDCPQELVYTRQFTAVDNCGNESTRTQTIFVIDESPPVIDCPFDQTIDCDDLESADTGTATASDNCDDHPVIEPSDQYIEGPCPNSYTIERTWTATDGCGNEASCVQLIHVVDDEEPDLDCPDDITLNCPSDLDLAGVPTVSDNCDMDPTVTYTQEMVAGSCMQEYTILRTWTATDACQNSASCVQEITIVDEVAPELTCPPTVTLSCAEDAYALGEPSAVDACDMTLSMSFMDEMVEGNCPQQFTIERTWTALDDCGNYSTCLQLIHVVDETPPTLEIPDDITLLCNDTETDTGYPVASDDCSFSCAQLRMSVGGEENCPSNVTISMSQTEQFHDCPQTRTVTRTWTATDDCGNSTSADQIIAYVDEEAPVFECPPEVTLDCADDRTQNFLTFASDNCDSDVEVTYVDDEEFHGCPDNITITRTYTATDDCGNESQQTQTIHVSDVTAPVLTCPGTLEVSCEVEADNMEPPMVMDDCDPQPTLTKDDVTVLGCGQSKVITRTWTATDACGNESSCTQTINFVDDEAPEIECHPDLLVDCSLYPDDIPHPEAYDNCDEEVTVTYVDEGTDEGCEGSYVVMRTYSATDACGNTGTHTQRITVVDSTPPTITCPEDVTMSCEDYPHMLADATAVDDCDDNPLVVPHDDIVTGCGHTKVVTRTWTATDSCGNETSCVQVITVTDDIAPAIDCPDSMELSCDQPLSAAPMATAIDNCDESVELEHADEEIPGDCPNEWTIVRTYTAVDDCGNTSTKTQTIQFKDHTPPYIVGLPEGDLHYDTDSGHCFATVDWDDPDYGDSCEGPVTLEQSHLSDTEFEVGTTTVEYTVTDACNNSTIHSFNIIVTDIEDPDIDDAPSDIEVHNDPEECGAEVSWTPPTADDNCGVQSFTSNRLPNEFFDVGTSTVTYAAVDIHGNTTSESFTVTVLDHEDPVIDDMPADISVNNDLGNCGAVVSWDQPSSDDNCEVESFSSDRQSGTTFVVGTTTVTYTAVDIYGNETSASFDVIVTDNENPVIHDGPMDLSVSNDPEKCEAAVHWNAPTATDNCAVYEFVSNHEPGDDFDVGTTTVTYNAVDIYGNESTHSFTITVTDDENPEIESMPEDISVTNDHGDCGAVVAWTEPSADDNCEVATFAPNRLPDSFFDVGSTIVTYVAVDIHGNESTASFTVTVTDDEDPEILQTPEDITITNDSGDCGAVVDWSEPSASDNCQVDSFESDWDPEDFFEVGTTTVTYIAIDIYGNMSTDSFTVTVLDTESPEIDHMPDHIALTNDQGECGATVTWDEPSADDNCEVASLTADASSGDFFHVGTTTVTYTAEDIYGNASAASFTITVTDNEDPEIDHMPQDISMSNEEGDCGAIVTWDEPSATDNCQVDTFVSNAHSDDFFQVGTTTVEYTATDIYGNSTARSFTVTITDDEDPEIDHMPSDITVNNDHGDCGALVTWDEPTASDNCLVQTFESDEDSGDFFNVGTTTVTYTAVDNHGNSSSASFTVTVIDNEDPTIDHLPADISANTDHGECGAIVTWDEPSADDNCDVDTFTPDASSGDFFPVGTTDVTYTAVDIHSNETSMTFTVTITDNEVPQIHDLPSDISVSNDLGDCGAIVTWVEPTASDNCEVYSFDSDEDSGDFFDVGTTTVTYTATDIYGLETLASFTVTVTDDEDPELTLPEDRQLSCPYDPMNPLEYATAEDNCDGDIQITFENEFDVSDQCSQNYVMYRTWTATDIHGNDTSSVQVIEVSDTEAPSIECPADATLSCEQNLTEAGYPTVSDNCDVDPDVSISDEVVFGDCEYRKTITRTWTATDECGNSSSCTQLITIIDESAPIFLNPPELLLLSCDDNLSTWGEPDVIDNCDSDPEVWHTIEIVHGDCPGIRTITRTFFAEDSCGNLTTHVQVIEYLDLQPPVIDCPSNITIECGENPYDLHEVGEADADDNCVEEVFPWYEDTGPVDGSFGQQIIFRTWRAVDCVGNESQCVQTITIEDTEPPIATSCPGNVIYSCDQQMPTIPLPTFFDTCDQDLEVETYENDPSAANTGNNNPDDDGDDDDADGDLDDDEDGVGGGQGFPNPPELGVCVVNMTLLTYVATDDAGNTAACHQWIIEIDNQNPILDMPSDMVIDCSENFNDIDTGTATATDNCGLPPTVTSFDTLIQGDCPQSFTILRTWRATDTCGNTTTQVQTIAITDSTIPEIHGPTDLELECDTPVILDISVLDDCGEAIFYCEHDLSDPDVVILDHLGGSNLEVTFLASGTAVITCLAFDECGNMSNSITFTVTATCDESCIGLHWKENEEDWCETPFVPEDGVCGPESTATLFLEAFLITDTFAFPGFDPDMTLNEALHVGGGTFNRMLSRGTAALLNASHSEIGFPYTPTEIRQVMQDAFAGLITDREAKQFFTNCLDLSGGCPLDRLSVPSEGEEEN